MKTILKILATLLLVAAINACDGDKDNEPKPENPENPENPNGGNGDNGTGTTADPFIVANKADLKRVASDETGPGGKWTEKSHYKQVADIDLSGEDWKPAWRVFEGSYDGGGYTISNLTTTASCGLFSTVSCPIKNVRLRNVTITHENSTGSILWAGGMVALLAGGSVENCSIDNIEFTCTYSGSLMFSVGGLVGASNQGTISSCMVTNGTVSCTGNGWVGGVLGRNVLSTTLENCYTTVNVSSINSEWGIGGIVGEGSVKNCYATGTITADGETYVGGIRGFGASEAQNCVALNKTVSTTQTGSSTIGRIRGQSSTYTTNSYARSDMTLTAGSSNVSTSDATTTSVHGANVSAADYNGANSETWWKDTAGFPEESWDFAPNRLPHLKGFDKLTQNPTVTP